ncbi:metal ABC transporter ATP-binding protein [Actinomadura rubrisoli]|uniref:Metal ABC transporter ATP-binding protein n=2 Tax=Actinomadura rubrisoli TaxID=2530368 RepID=A0A4R5BUR4_9ACTN|nr:metal ABC transporter ATP-binding protein [Actinomadura rubrisoli]
MTGGQVRRDGREVLAGVTLRVEAGDVVAVLGPNGAGKSTLVKAMLGLIPLAGGRTEIYGAQPSAFRDWKRIGYVPQRLPMGGGVPSTVREVVSSGRVARQSRWRPTSAADRAAVDRALEAVGLADLARESAHLLSGGQQQRVLIARALAGEPDVFVMDEPTAGVDAGSQSALAATLRELAGTGRTVVLVAHGLGPMAPLITRTVELEHGRVVRETALGEAMGKTA